MVKNISILLAQIVAVIFGTLTVFGISVDPTVQTEIQSQVGNAINAVAGTAIVVTTLVGSIKSVIDKIRSKE